MKPQAWHRQALVRLLAVRERLPHALLVAGPRGIGKQDFVRALGAALLCGNPDGERLACGSCAACGWFAAGNHPDYRETVPEASQEDGDDVEASDARGKKKSQVIRVSEVRALQDFVMLSAHRGGIKVAVLNPAEALPPAAANALLKTLEEPPADTLIILLAQQPGRLLATLRSRCQRVDLAAPTHAEACSWLAARGVPDAEEVAGLAAGGPLLAEQFAAPESSETRRVLLQALGQGTALDPLSVGPRLEKGALDTTLYLMQTWLHDLIRVGAGGAPRFHAPRAEALRALAGKANLAAAHRLLAQLADLRRLASHPLSPRLVYEALLISYAECFMATGQ